MEIQEVFSLLSKSRMPEVILAICNQEKYFTFISEYINEKYGKIVPATVNRRLNDLVDLELVEKVPFENRPSDFSYLPTAELHRIHTAILALISSYEGRPTSHQGDLGVEVLGRIHNLQGILKTESIEETVRILVDQAENQPELFSYDK